MPCWSASFCIRPARLSCSCWPVLWSSGWALSFTIYNVYAKLIDERLRGGPYSTTARIFAAPEAVAVGDKTTPSEIAAQLRHAGYNENRNNPVGSYTVQADSIDIFPGAESYFDQEPATVKFARGKIIRIVSLARQHRAGRSTSWNRS